jgi:hypothetical protein
MWNKKLGFATLALGSFLTLLGPTAASARDRDGYRQNTSFRNRDNERERERLRLERERFERFEQQRRNRDRRYSDWHRY